MSRSVDPLRLAHRLAALCASVRARLDRSHPLCTELHISAELARLDVVDGTLAPPVRPEAWIPEWDAISYEVHALLASEGDTSLGRARVRRWDHHSSVVRAELEAWRAAA